LIQLATFVAYWDERVVEDGVGRGIEGGARVVDCAEVRVEFAIAIDVWASDPKLRSVKVSIDTRGGEILCCGVSSVVLPTPVQFGQKLSALCEHTEDNGRG